MKTMQNILVQAVAVAMMPVLVIGSLFQKKEH